MRLLGFAIKVKDFAMGTLRVDTWFDTVYQLLIRYQYGQRFIAWIDNVSIWNISPNTLTVVNYGIGGHVLIPDNFPKVGTYGGYNPITGRFTAFQDGYYQFTAGAGWSFLVDSYIALHKNDVEDIRGSYCSQRNCLVSGMIYLNVGDYVDARVYQSSASTQTLSPSSSQTHFTGYLARPI
jgi:hypothetical protein